MERKPAEVTIHKTTCALCHQPWEKTGHRVVRLIPEDQEAWAQINQKAKSNVVAIRRTRLIYSLLIAVAFSIAFFSVAILSFPIRWFVLVSIPVLFVLFLLSCSHVATKFRMKDNEFVRQCENEKWKIVNLYGVEAHEAWMLGVPAKEK